jgi:hypothetical protein
VRTTRPYPLAVFRKTYFEECAELLDALQSHLDVLANGGGAMRDGRISASPEIVQLLLRASRRQARSRPRAAAHGGRATSRVAWCNAACRGDTRN